MKIKLDEMDEIRQEDFKYTTYLDYLEILCPSTMNIISGHDRNLDKTFTFAPHLWKTPLDFKSLLLNSNDLKFPIKGHTSYLGNCDDYGYWFIFRPKRGFCSCFGEAEGSHINEEQQIYVNEVVVAGLAHVNNSLSGYHLVIPSDGNIRSSNYGKQRKNYEYHKYSNSSVPLLALRGDNRTMPLPKFDFEADRYRSAFFKEHEAMILIRGYI
jgi:hypothetical protein